MFFRHLPNVLFIPQVFLTLSPFSAGIKGQHPDCDEEGFNETIDPRNCTCQRYWPCLKCQENACFFVKCKSNVSDGTDIRCVSCGKGKNLITEKNHECQPRGFLFSITRSGNETESRNEQSTISTSTVTATFSSLFNSIKINTTGTPFIPSLTPVPSRTPLTRPAGHDHPESLKWIKGMTSIMGVFSFIIVCGFLIYLFKKIRKNRRSRNLRQVDEVSFYRRRGLNGHCTHGAAYGSRKNPGAVYSNKDHEVVTGDQLDNMAEKGSVQKGILSSLDGKPSNSTEKGWVKLGITNGSII